MKPTFLVVPEYTLIFHSTEQKFAKIKVTKNPWTRFKAIRPIPTCCNREHTKISSARPRC